MTKDWISIEKAKILLIGHDPRLQISDSLAKFAMFADYYFKDLPDSHAEKKKYDLAKSTFEQIIFLTNGKFNPENIYITNLCNIALKHAPRGKTVLIPSNEAEHGLKNIKKILSENPSINYLFPMSLQVNYWLQKLGLYNSNDNFVLLSEPKEIGIKNVSPYYLPKTNKTFAMICGKIFNINEGRHKVIPILHAKNYPLKGKFYQIYRKGYEQIRKYFDNK